jgi:5-oxopent-3-ene-1,2,5-tricarboxylate decarboxylase/2-hydroxyhepta-2,4-diene-1,7-dioate isomerase
MTTVLARRQGAHYLSSIECDAADPQWERQDWDVPISGTVVGVLLNDREAALAYEEDFERPPYGQPPQAPVLYLKPANTWSAHQRTVVVPRGTTALELGACVGVVLGTTASGVVADCAIQHILGYIVINDLCVPHESFYRPAIRERCRDGFCPIGPWIMPRAAVRSPDALVLRTFVNGVLRAETSTAGLQRRTAELIAEITQFMTLRAGDVLLLAPGADRPLGRPGDRVRIEVPGVGMVENPLVGEELLDPQRG